MRKFNVGLRKMELFGIDFVVGIPKWANFSDVEIIVDKFMDNLVTDSYKK